MSKTLLWQERVFNNDFRCDYCLEKLVDTEEEKIYALEGRLSGINHFSLLACPTCGKIVGVVLPENSEYKNLDRKIRVEDLPEEMQVYLL